MLHCIKYNVGIVFVSSWTLIGDIWCRVVQSGAGIYKLVLALDMSSWYLVTGTKLVLALDMSSWYLVTGTKF